MLFSVIIPVYNVEKYLTQCLDSIVGQCGNEEDIEILLIDDGSTDRSGRLCDDYSKRFHNIKVYHNSNHGLLYSRRFGLSKSSGEYIINCDSDDYFQSDMIAVLKNAISCMPSDILLFNMNTEKEGKLQAMTEHIFESQGQNMFYVDMKQVLEKFVSSTDIVSLCTKVYKRKCANPVADYSEYIHVRNGEDTLQSVEIFTNAQSAVYIDKALYNYRIGSGMTSCFDETYFSSFEKTFKLMKCANEQWKLGNIDILIAERLFHTLGRAITQIRYAEKLNHSLVRQFCRNLLENELVKEYIPLYCSVRSKILPRYYRLLLSLLVTKQYWAIAALLKAKNLTGK